MCKTPALRRCSWPLASMVMREPVRNLIRELQTRMPHSWFSQSGSGRAISYTPLILGRRLRILCCATDSGFPSSSFFVSITQIARAIQCAKAIASTGYGFRVRRHSRQEPLLAPKWLAAVTTDLGTAYQMATDVERQFPQSVCRDTGTSTARPMTLPSSRSFRTVSARSSGKRVVGIGFIAPLRAKSISSANSGKEPT